MSGVIADSPFWDSSKFAGKKVHLIIGGSVACYKALDIMRAWQNLSIQLSATLTNGGKQFITPLLLAALGAEPVYGDMFGLEEVFGHLEPGQQADALTLCPATANLMAKIANGLADDMASAQVLAFDGPIVIAPAMNPKMWANAATQENVQRLMQRGLRIVQPESGKVACGDTGQGRLAAPAEIFLAALKALSPQDMQDLHVLLTLGPTREYWDGVRFWSNPSSGKMGAALATAAWLRGASVTAVCGPDIEAYMPLEIGRIEVMGAAEMFEACEKAWAQTDIGIFCAAVCDFAPVRVQGERKIKKFDYPDGLSVRFEVNRDILATLAKKRVRNQRILGFAAEVAPDMASLRKLAQDKLDYKGADIIAGNRVNGQHSAFGAKSAEMAVADKNGRVEIWQEKSKADIAWDLLSWLLTI